MKINILKAMSIIGAFVILSASLEAKTTNWWSNGSDWNLASNWTNGLPVNGDIVNVSSGGTGHRDPIMTSSSLYNANINLNVSLTIRGANLSSYAWDINLGYSGSLIIENGTTFNNDAGTISSVYAYGRSTKLTVREGACAIFKDIEFSDISEIKIENASTLIIQDVFSLYTGLKSKTIISGGSSILTAQSTSLNRTTNIDGILTLDNGIFAAGKIGDTTQSIINIAATATLEFYLSTSSTNKIINNYGSIDIADGATLSLDFDDVSSIVGGESFDIFDATTITGTFTDINLATLAAGLGWDLSQLYTNGIVSIAGSIIPEPSTYAIIFGTFALAFAIYRRRK